MQRSNVAAPVIKDCLKRGVCLNVVLSVAFECGCSRD